MKLLYVQMKSKHWWKRKKNHFFYRWDLVIILRKLNQLFFPFFSEIIIILLQIILQSFTSIRMWSSNHVRISWWNQFLFSFNDKKNCNWKVFFLSSSSYFDIIVKNQHIGKITSTQAYRWYIEKLEEKKISRIHLHMIQRK